MKYIFALFAALWLLTGCTSSKCEQKNNAAAIPAMQNRLLLPPVIYAVPGVECNIYFSNIFLCINQDNFVFDVDCAKGSNGLRRWFFTPGEKDAGEYPLTINVYNDNGLVASGKTYIKVSPADSGKDKAISILVIGDSLTNGTVYPSQLLKLTKAPGNPKLTMIGSHQGDGRKPVKGGVAHEGYPGWTWGAFLTRFNDEKLCKTPRQKFYAKSKFLTSKNGKAIFDLQQYLDKYNGGKQPDFITIQLGVNDVFNAKDNNQQKVIAAIEKNMDTMIANIRKAAPNAVLGVGLVTSGAWQDAFGANYKSGQTAWQYRKNVFALNRRMIEKFSGYQEKKLILIPANVNLDCENNFPAVSAEANARNVRNLLRQSNGVHPDVTGYKQMGDSFYAWLKYCLNTQK